MRQLFQDIHIMLSRKSKICLSNSGFLSNSQSLQLQPTGCFMIRHFFQIVSFEITILIYSFMFIPTFCLPKALLSVLSVPLLYSVFQATDFKWELPGRSDLPPAPFCYANVTITGFKSVYFPSNLVDDTQERSFHASRHK